MNIVVFLVVTVFDLSSGNLFDPSLSQVMVGSGFPWKTQVKDTLACSSAVVETGLDWTVTPTVEDSEYTWREVR